MSINKLKATVISLLLLAAPAFAQRTVMVSSNNSAILYPSNFFTANAASARSGLALQAFVTNPVIPQTNGGTGATNAAVARTNLGLGWSALTNTDATNFRTAISLASYVTNPIVPLTNGGLGTTNIATARTNLGLGWSALTNTDATNFRTAISLASYVTNPIVPVINGGTGATNDIGALSNLGLGAGSTNEIGFGTVRIPSQGISFIEPIDQVTVLFIPSDTDPVQLSPIHWNNASVRSALGLGWTALTNTDATNFRTAIGLASYVTNPTIPITNGGTGATNAATARTNIGLGWSALTNTDATNFRTAISLASHATNPIIAITEGGTGATNAATARTNLGLGWSALTNTDGNTFLAAAGGLSVSNTSQAIVASTYQFQAATNDNPANFSQMGLGSGSGGEYGGFYARNDGLFKMAFASGTATNTLSDRILFRTTGLELAVPLKFIGTNVTVNSAQSRTNLGLGWSALTNTDPVNFRTAIGLASYVTNTIIPLTNGGLGTADITTARTNLGIPLAALTNTTVSTFQGAIFTTTNSAPTNTTNIVGWINIQVGTSTNSYKLPLYQ